MQELKMFMLPACPHCRRAKAIIAELLEAHPEYKEVPFTEIDEKKESELANSYDYYYVPAFFAGNEKIAEGAPSEEMIEKAFAAAYNG